MVDLASTKGTFVDLGSGWNRIAPNVPTVLPPGGRVRLGECATRIVYPSKPPAQAAGAAAEQPAPSAPQAPEPEQLQVEEDTAPRFSGLLSSTLVRDDGQHVGVEGSDGQDLPTTSAAANETQNGAGADEGSDPESEDAVPALKNADFRAALLPFLVKPVSDPDPRDAQRQKRGKRGKKRGAHEDSEDDEPAAPIVLDKNDPAAGLVLRKEKAQVKKKGSTVKIKF